MNKILLFASLVLIFAAQTGADCGRRKAKGTSHIIGGVETNRGDYPWQTQILLSGNHHCGGSIINNRWILTAAHCLTQPESKYTVYAGTWTINKKERWSRQRHHIESYFIHPAHNVQTMANDIALIKTKDTIKYGDYVQPVCLPSHGNQFTHNSGAECYASGWGYTTSRTQPNPQFPSKMMHIREDPVSDSYCDYPGYNSGLMLCTGGKGGAGVCGGDSGGPLSCRSSPSEPFYVAGIASYTSPNCADNYDVFTRVGTYHSWIHAVIA